MNEQNIQVGDYVVCKIPFVNKHKYSIQEAIPDWIDGMILQVEQVEEGTIKLVQPNADMRDGEPWFDPYRFEKVNPFVVAVRTINHEHERDQTGG